MKMIKIKINNKLALILLLITANAYSFNMPSHEGQIFTQLAKNSLLSAMLELSHNQPESCDLAKKIISDENNFVTDSDSTLVDSNSDLINLAKKTDNQCRVMSFFKKTILPILKKDGVVTAHIDKRYMMRPTPQLLKIKLINLQKKEDTNALNQCAIKATVFIDEEMSFSMNTQSLDCKVDSYTVSIPMHYAFKNTTFIACIKQISWLPEFVQSCKAFEIMKDQEVIIPNNFNYNAIALNNSEIQRNDHV